MPSLKTNKINADEYYLNGVKLNLDMTETEITALKAKINDDTIAIKKYKTDANTVINDTKNTLDTIKKKLAIIDKKNKDILSSGIFSDIKSIRNDTRNIEGRIEQTIIDMGKLKTNIRKINKWMAGPTPSEKLEKRLKSVKDLLEELEKKLKNLKSPAAVETGATVTTVNSKYLDIIKKTGQISKKVTTETSTIDQYTIEVECYSAKLKAILQILITISEKITTIGRFKKAFKVIGKTVYEFPTIKAPKICLVNVKLGVTTDHSPPQTTTYATNYGWAIGTNTDLCYTKDTTHFDEAQHVGLIGLMIGTEHTNFSKITQQFTDLKNIHTKKAFILPDGGKVAPFADLATYFMGSWVPLPSPSTKSIFEDNVKNIGQVVVEGQIFSEHNTYAKNLRIGKMTYASATTEWYSSVDRHNPTSRLWSYSLHEGYTGNLELGENNMCLASDSFVSGEKTATQSTGGLTMGEGSYLSSGWNICGGYYCYGSARYSITGGEFSLGGADNGLCWGTKCYVSHRSNQRISPKCSIALGYKCYAYGDGCISLGAYGFTGIPYNGSLKESINCFAIGVDPIQYNKGIRGPLAEKKFIRQGSTYTCPQTKEEKTKVDEDDSLPWNAYATDNTCNNRFQMNSKGYVGIGQTCSAEGIEESYCWHIDYPLEVRGYVKQCDDIHCTTTFPWERDVGNATPFPAQLSIYMDQNMCIKSGTLTSSDERIKKNIIEVPDNLSLQMIRNMSCKYYEYKDVAVRGSRKTIGFIAQQIKSILPIAVNRFSDIIPNEFRTSTQHTWESFIDSDENIKYKLTINDLNETVGKQIYRFKVKNLDSDEESIDTISLEDSPKSFIFDKRYDSVFIHGKGVDDFLSITYSNIFTANFSASQEVDRIQQEEISKVAALELENIELRNRLSAIEAILNV